EVNGLERHEFTNIFARLFEHSPWIAARTAGKRPFANRAEFFAALRDTVMKARDDEKLCLIRAHPDLVGNATLTRESTHEQASAGLGNLTDDEVAQFQSFNREYKERFGFPFVICARENKKEAILAAFPHRLSNSRPVEIDTALREIFKIAELRLKDLVE
ncbi:MAG TPA: 2-oxo-4-hydroxy-4-carboxy-5-ureidoimidazoline decarboxylase, partial [Chthoniobacterales bacterium]|nr:2-oxo-4-hydroxy-4-carboxy-5-ureidoimidazoline decarboxylase [Chthoniobacterales bacterium]